MGIQSQKESEERETFKCNNGDEPVQQQNRGKNEAAWACFLGEKMSNLSVSVGKIKLLTSPKSLDLKQGRWKSSSENLRERKS